MLSQRLQGDQDQVHVMLHAMSQVVAAAWGSCLYLAKQGADADKRLEESRCTERCGAL